MHGVVCTQCCGRDLDKSLGILGCPAFLHLAILSKLVLDQIVRTVDTDGREAIGTQFENGCSVDIALRRREHCLYVTHHRLQVLAFMQEHSVPVGHLVFPVLLPLAEGVLLQEAVCTDDEHRSSCLEAHTPLYADDGITDVHVTTNGIGCAYLLHFLYGLHRIVIGLSVDGFQLALLERQAQLFGAILCAVLQVCTFGQSLRGVKNLSATD